MWNGVLVYVADCKLGRAATWKSPRLKLDGDSNELFSTLLKLITGVPVTPDEEGPLSGITFCFTGSSTRPRAELGQLVESRGGRVLASVTKELAYLVIADPASTSSKAVKARKLGTKLITEDELDALIADREKAAAPEKKGA